MLTKIKKNNFSVLFLSIMSLLMIVGFVMLFIKPLIGVFMIVAAGFINLYLNKNFPDFMESLKNKKTHAGAWVREYSIKHIQGINFVDYEQNIKLKIFQKNISFFDSEKELLNLDFSQIENVLILEEIEQTQKNKSVIARAIVGGLLLGGVGAIVGGISGACPTLKSNKKYFLEISNGPEKIIITAGNDTLKQIKNSISSQVKG